MNGRKGSILVDISHPIARIDNESDKNNPHPESGLDLYEWEDSDPLADAFLCSYGEYPKFDFTGVDYLGMASLTLLGQRNIIRNGEEIQIPTMGRETVASLSTAFIDTHYSVQNHWNRPGFLSW